MGTDRDLRLETLIAAIGFEQEGRKFFLDAAERTSDYFGRTVFRSLADEELAHIERIEAIERSLSDHGQWPPAESRAARTTRGIFSEARMHMDEMIKDRTGDLQAVKLAMDLEQRGFEFYSNLAAKAVDSREKAFYQRLAQEEKQHLRILEETWNALVACGSSSLG